MQNANAATVLEPKVQENEVRVKHYYNYTRLFYKYFWHGKTDSLHYGFYDETVKSHKEALLRTIEITAKSANIVSEDNVVDFGCGVGGTAFWIAKNIGAKVSGITLSEAQYNKAQRLRVEYSLENSTEFVLGDFFKTPYHDERFNVLVSIEAACHGQHEVEALAKEMFRVLKPGGKLAVTDGFVGPKILTGEERKRLTQFEEGFALVQMITTDAFMTALREAGFKEVAFEDWTTGIIPTAERMYKLTTKWHWFILLMTRLKIIPDIILKNNITAHVQKDLFKNRTLVYGCITAQK